MLTSELTKSFLLTRKRDERYETGVEDDPINTEFLDRVAILLGIFHTQTD